MCKESEMLLVEMLAGKLCDTASYTADADQHPCVQLFDYLFFFCFLKNEKEDVIAAMWRHVALNSKAPEEQLAAYQNAIESLEV